MKLRCSGVFALFVVFSSQAAEIPQSTVVRFNTVCARCHEGECSGRLSFGLDYSLSANHMRRHTGEVTVDAQKDLYELLVYMKKRCAYYPMRTPAPAAGGLDRAMLAQLRSPVGDAYFVPLGELTAGRYRARLGFSAAAEACAQVISSSFEISEHPGLKTTDQGIDLEFVVDEGMQYYLRVQLARPGVMERLEILK